MVMYCLDTNVIIDLFRGEEKLKEKVLEGGVDQVFLTTISLCELYKGAYISKRKDKSLEEIKNFLLGGFSVASLDYSSFEEFGKIYNNLNSKGLMIPEFDIMIAAIVKANDLILVTRDKKHYAN